MLYFFENNNVPTFLLKIFTKLLVLCIVPIHPTSSYCQRVFNIFYDELEIYELIITLNANETCIEMYDTFVNDEKLQKAAKINHLKIFSLICNIFT